MSAPSVEVLLPSYNDGRRTAYIRECVLSLKAQTFAAFRCVVSDNASPVPFEQAAGDLLDERFEVVRQPRNLGLFGNWNWLYARTTSARWLALLEDDNAWRPAHLERLVQGVEAHPSASLAVSRTTFVYDDGRAEEPFRPVYLAGGGEGPRFVDPATLCASSVFRHSIQSSATLVAAEAVQRHLPFDETFPFSDGLIWNRIASEGGLVDVPYEGLRYRFHVASASSSDWLTPMSLPRVSSAAAALLLELEPSPARRLLALGREEGPSSWWNVLQALHLVGTQAASAVATELLADYPGALLSPRKTTWRRPDELLARAGLRAMGLPFLGRPYEAIGQARRQIGRLRRRVRRLH